MFYLDRFGKITYFKVNNNYTLDYQYIYGSTGIIEISFLYYENLFSSRNFRGKPIAIPINSETDHILFYIMYSEYIFFYKLKYNMRNKGIEEIKSGETRSQIMLGGYFPLYYYLKIKEENYTNVDINLRLNSYNESALQNNFDVKGYMLDEDTINRKMRGEYINLLNPLDGYYSNKFKVGFLQLNKKIENNDKYLLLEIRSLGQNYINSYLLVELVTKEYYQDIYCMPINQYILETFNDKNNQTRDENQYYISINMRNVSQVLIELSPEYNDIEIKFKNVSNVSVTYATGFKKYRIWQSDNDNVYFNVTNPSKRDANYMIRYYYSEITLECTYIFDDNVEKKVLFPNEQYATVYLTFNSIKIKIVNEPLDSNIISFSINGLLYKSNDNSEELFNTTIS